MGVAHLLGVASTVPAMLQNLSAILCGSRTLLGISLAGGVVGLSKSISNPYWFHRNCDLHKSIPPIGQGYAVLADEVTQLFLIYVGYESKNLKRAV